MQSLPALFADSGAAGGRYVDRPHHLQEFVASEDNGVWGTGPAESDDMRLAALVAGALCRGHVHDQAPVEGLERQKRSDDRTVGAAHVKDVAPENGSTTRRLRRRAG